MRSGRCIPTCGKRARALLAPPFKANCEGKKDILHFVVSKIGMWHVSESFMRLSAALYMDALLATIRKIVGKHYTSLELPPVPRIITGLLAAFSSSTVPSIAAVCGPGPYGKGDETDPQDIKGLCTGVNNTSTGKSSRTGPIDSKYLNCKNYSGSTPFKHLPGAPESATPIAYFTIRGVSSGFVIR